jgi:uracil-DNA glycosylase
MINLHESWLKPLQAEFDAPYMVALKAFLVAEREAGKRIFPRAGAWFHALDATPLDRVRVVILGQDPYHGEGQAHGLCFSVQPGVPPPPSLVNIYKEMKTDLGLEPPRHGYLENWTKQGVLLLNSVLTVEANMAASHQGKGWERFTDAVIREVNALPHPVVFILWGRKRRLLMLHATMSSNLRILRHLRHITDSSVPSRFREPTSFSKAKAWHRSIGNYLLLQLLRFFITTHE